MEARLKILSAPLAKNILLSVVSTGLMLFLIEMVLRVTEVVPAHTLEYVSPEQWNSTPGPLLPGQSFTDRFKMGLPYRISVSNIGFRGPDVTVSKPAGTYRILCLGDSYTFGAYVNDEQTWPFQLETRLREDLPGRPLEVINAGISGFTIVDELGFLKEHGLDLRPDAVVVAFVLNDLADLTRGRSSREVLKLSVEENARDLLGPLKVHLRQTAIYNALFLLKAYARKATGEDDTIQKIDIRHLIRLPYDQTTLDLFDEYRGYLAEMKRILDERHIRLVFVIFPYWEQISRDAPAEAQRRLTEMAEGLDIPVVDLLPEYKRQDPTGRKFFHMPLDHHPSARGYRCAAGVLAGTFEPMIARDTQAPESLPASAPAAP